VILVCNYLGLNDEDCSVKSDHRCFTCLLHRSSWDNEVHVLTWWMTAVRFPVGEEFLLFTTISRLALGPTQPPIQGVLGALSLWVK
jgi:hypothetical protein